MPSNPSTQAIQPSCKLWSFIPPSQWDLQMICIFQKYVKISDIIYNIITNCCSTLILQMIMTIRRMAFLDHRTIPIWTLPIPNQNGREWTKVSTNKDSSPILFIDFHSTQTQVYQQAYRIISMLDCLLMVQQPTLNYQLFESSETTQTGVLQQEHPRDVVDLLRPWLDLRGQDPPY